MAFHISSQIYRGKRVFLDKETMGKLSQKSEEMDAEKRTFVEGSLIQRETGFTGPICRRT
jgi:hypothetical protein